MFKYELAIYTITKIRGLTSLIIINTQQIQQTNMSNAQPPNNQLIAQKCTIFQNKTFQLVSNSAGIYICYWISGIYQQKILRQPYRNQQNDQQAFFGCPSTACWSMFGIAWLFNYLLNFFIYKDRTDIPISNLIACASIINISALTTLVAVYVTNFPIVMMIKSCNVVSVVLVGVCCSGVRDVTLKLGPKKILIAVLITIGILLYNFGGDSKSQNKATSLIGIGLLIVSLISDGFLPDFQAIIKSQYNPSPTIMAQKINKWVFILTFTYGVICGKVLQTFLFGRKYPTIIFDIFVHGIFSAVGQLFVYRLIKQFKQHIVPFVITTRKIFTVIISIIAFQHQTQILQFIGIAIAFFTVCYQYISEILSSKKIQTQKTYKAQKTQQKSGLNSYEDFAMEEKQQEKLETEVK